MADKKPETKIIEREYIIPLRKEWRKVANYRRAGRAAKFIKQFIARHMKVPDRDISKVKLDIYLNQELWFRGKKKPPAKIKVRVSKKDDLVHVTLAEMPKEVKFQKAKHKKFHTEAPTKPKEPKKDVMPAEKTEEKKKDEEEKTKASAEQKEKIAEQQAKAEKHMPKENKTPIHRQALKK
jgi:large subunit ribosomal protein L31e